jgi:hypothetical protein
VGNGEAEDMGVNIVHKRARAWLTAAASRGIDVRADKDGYLSVIADLLEEAESDATRCPNCDNLRLELGEERHRLRAYHVLRQAVDAMMAPLGYHGTISARDDRVQAVMDALAQIDAEDRA